MCVCVCVCEQVCIGSIGVRTDLCVQVCVRTCVDTGVWTGSHTCTEVYEQVCVLLCLWRGVCGGVCRALTGLWSDHFQDPSPSGSLLFKPTQNQRPSVLQRGNRRST